MKKHFTATVYIVSKVDNQVKVLLHLHKKLKFWLGVGGHVEGYESPVEAVIREAEEEAGVKVKLIQKNKKIKTETGKMLPVPFAIFEAYIPAYRYQKAHYHIDLVYFGIINNPEKIRMKEQFNWFSKNELKKFKIPAEVSHYAEEAIRVGNNFFKT